MEVKLRLSALFICLMSMEVSSAIDIPPTSSTTLRFVSTRSATPSSTTPSTHRTTTSATAWVSTAPRTTRRVSSSSAPTFSFGTTTTPPTTRRQPTNSQEPKTPAWATTRTTTRPTSTAYSPVETRGYKTELQLIGGSKNAGRVEIRRQVNNVWSDWGTICDDGWSNADASVACRQLGYKWGQYFGRSKYGKGKGPIWLDELACQGSESTLSDCVHGGWGKHDCEHDEDASVECYNSTVTLEPVTNGDNYGNVEVTINGLLYGVCRRGFDDVDARVACRELGYVEGRALPYVVMNTFREPVYRSVTNVNCTGAEQSLEECDHVKQTYSCFPDSLGINQGRDLEEAFATVICFRSAEEARIAPKQQYRLAENGGAPNWGTVQIDTFGKWLPICSSGVTDMTATVVCKSLGYKYGNVFGGTYGVPGISTVRPGIPRPQTAYKINPIIVRSPMCDGSEEELQYCRAWGQMTSGSGRECGFSKTRELTVLCSEEALKMRLVGSGNNTNVREGRVEIMYNGQWGTICNIPWSSSSANLVCQQLGFRGGRIPSIKYHGATGPVFLNGVTDCSPNSRYIWRCMNNGWGVGSDDFCRLHKNDAAVSCYNNVQLEDGGSNYGRVSVYSERTSSWLAVCGTAWEDSDAKVVCRELGFLSGISLCCNSFGTKFYVSALSYVHDCRGNETALSQCPTTQRYCTSTYRNYASVMCFQEAVLEDVTIRLDGGYASSKSFNGRIQLHMGKHTFRMCSTLWDDRDARVACRQLGFKGGVAYMFTYGGTGPTVATHVSCRGNETTLKDCAMNVNGRLRCSYDAAVLCYKEQAPKLEIEGNGMSGRLVISYEGSKGHVCDTSWSDLDAKVACKHMGFKDGRSYRQQGGVSSTRPIIYMDKLFCTGQETSLWQCRNPGWQPVSSGSCYDMSRHAGVTCFNDVRLNPIAPGTKDTVLGWVQVLKFGLWGGVCGTGFDENAAKVFCMELGKFNYSKLVSGYNLRANYDTMMIYSINCNGSESSLFDCAHKTQGGCKNARNNYAAAVCSRQPLDTDYKVTLQRVRGSDHGQVQVTKYGFTGRICVSNWNEKAAQVVCRQLRYQSGFSMITAPTEGTTRLFWLVNYNCTGSEAKIQDCKQMSAVRSCSQNSVATAVCHDSKGLEWRLGGGAKHYGRVELKFKNQWGTICDRGWDDRDARVICRQLGYIDGSVRRSFDSGLGVQWLSDIGCSGSEENLLKCSQMGWNSTSGQSNFYIGSCGVGHDAAVFCYDRVKLYGSYNQTGPVLANLGTGSSWLSVCDDGFDDVAARVTCRQLGFLNGHTVCCSAFGKYSYYGSQWLSKVKCTGGENSLLECQYDYKLSTDCMHSSGYASVACYDTNPAKDVAWQISPTNKLKYTGVVMVKYAGVWGNICPNSWNDTDATVMCRSQGFKQGYAFPQISLENRAPYWLKEVSCAGAESSLDECTHPGWGNISPCDLSKGAGILCTKESGVKIKLSGPDAAQGVGRVDVTVDGTLGTICREDWDDREARVVCRELGYTDGEALSGLESYNVGTGEIWLRNLQCTGEEASLLECAHTGWGVFVTPDPNYKRTCDSHNYDVGVKCYNQVRLTQASPPSEKFGAVEMHTSPGRWLRICDDNFDDNAAKVICRELGHTDGVHVCCGAFGGSSVTGIADFKCKGDESRTKECQMTITTTCPSRQYASVLCSSGKLPQNGTIDVTWDLKERLLATYTSSGGDTLSGAVCPDTWSDVEASVFCRSQGYKGGVSVHVAKRVSTPVLISYNCSGATEATSLSDCVMTKVFDKRDGLSCSQISHTIAGTVCYNTTGVQLRLAGTPAGSQYGRVEMAFDGVWGQVCSIYWTDRISKVACRMMGYNDGVEYAPRLTTSMPNSAPTFIDINRCTGNEDTLLQCSHRGWGVRGYSCMLRTGDRTQSYCFKNARLHAYSVPLYDLSHGYVEVWHNNHWELVCADSWTHTEAMMLCKQLGFKEGLATCCNPYGPKGRLSISVTCDGDDATFDDCRRETLTSSCSGNYASVVCHNGNPIKDLEVKLDSKLEYTGRVLAKVAGVWGHICGDEWDDNDATVVCRQMGYRAGQAYYHYMRESTNLSTEKGWYIPPYWTTKVQCEGDETSLQQCTKDQWGSVTKCTSNYAAGALCTNDKGIFYRMVGNNPDDNFGRVEVSVNGVWGTICNTNWDAYDARVFCRMMGYSDGTRRSYKPGKGNVWMSHLQCKGDEESLDDCAHAGFDVNYDSSISTACRSHKADAGVYCFNSVRFKYQQNKQRAGQLQVHAKDSWWAVCDTGFTNTEARVACREMGFSDGRAVCCGAYGTNYYPFVLNQTVSCEGNETHMADCLTELPCDNLQSYASVICLQDTDDTTTFNTSLAGDGEKLGHGIVQVKWAGIVGRICATNWDDADARVMCKTLGHENGLAWYQDTSVTIFDGLMLDVQPFLLSEFNCTGMETDLMECPHRGMDKLGNCTNAHNAGVLCYNGDDALKFRLNGSSESNQGRVEIQIGGVWGTVCDQAWDDKDAGVLCRMMGFNDGTALHSAHYGEGSGPIWLSNVNCHGNEVSLHACPHRGWNISFTSRYPYYPSGPHIERPVYETKIDTSIKYYDVMPYYMCTSHGNDASVYCYNNIKTSLGTNSSHGAVQVWQDGAWGLVCDDNWTDINAKVTCQMLGYVDGKALRGSAYGKVDGKITLVNVNCRGKETSILDCERSQKGSKCTNNTYASVYCSMDTIEHTTLNIRLSEDKYSGDYYGIVEVQTLTGFWGRICNNKWGNNEATVACKQLGFKGGLPYLHTSKNKLPILMSNVSCSGAESSLVGCTYTPKGDSEVCTYDGYEAGVICYKNEISMKLSGSTNEGEGMVEIVRDGEKGYLCNSLPYSTNAYVVCRQMGYATGIAFSRNPFLPTLPRVWMVQLQCTGKEANVTQCLNTGWNVATSNYAGLRCSVQQYKLAVKCYSQEPSIKGVRLLGKQKDSNQVEVRVYPLNEYGGVCQEMFTDNDAKVVCRQLGYAGTSRKVVSQAMRNSRDMFVKRLGCIGNETAVSDCPNIELGFFTCDLPAQVYCSDTVEVTPSTTTAPPRSTTQSTSTSTSTSTSASTSTTSPSSSSTSSSTSSTASSSTSSPSSSSTSSSSTTTSSTTASTTAQKSTKPPTTTTTATTTTATTTTATTPSSTIAPTRKPSVRSSTGTTMKPTKRNEVTTESVAPTITARAGSNVDSPSGVPVFVIILPIIIILLIVLIVILFIVWKKRYTPPAHSHLTRSPSVAMSDISNGDSNGNLDSPGVIFMDEPKDLQFSNKLYELLGEQAEQTLDPNHSNVTGVVTLPDFNGDNVNSSS